MIDILIYFGQNMIVGWIIGFIALAIGLPYAAASMSKGSALSFALIFSITMLISVSAIVPSFSSHIIGKSDEYYEQINASENKNNVQQLKLNDSEIKKLKEILNKS